MIPKAAKLAIINGVTGQDGAYLSQLLLSQGYTVIGISRYTNASNIRALKYLEIHEQIQLIQSDVMSIENCIEILQKYEPQEFYNLGAQSSVSYSFSYPKETINYNVNSVLNFLEAIRKVNPEIRYYQASSSEMYGKIDHLPVTLSSALHPVSPYGISKATGHWLVNHYREAYKLYAVSGILFNHESFLRPESFFVKKVIRTAIQIHQGKAEALKVGNIDLRRDFGYAKEYVKAIWLMLQPDHPQDYHVCSGVSTSLRDIVSYVFDHYNISHNRIEHDPNLFRPAEIEDIYGDNSGIKSKGWQYNYSFYEVLDILMAEEELNLISSGT